MTKRDKQYHDFFKLLGYEFVYYPDKNSFQIKDVGYAKVCDFPATETMKDLACQASIKQDIILLDGNLTFKSYLIFSQGREWTGGIFIKNGDKYHPFYWSYDYDVDSFPETSVVIAKIINGSDIVCQRCGSINDFIIQKPSIHYKCTCKCGSFIKNIGTNEPATLYFGKYKGREISSMRSDEELNYLNWLLNNSQSIKGKLLDAIKYQLSL